MIKDKTKLRLEVDGRLVGSEKIASRLEIELPLYIGSLPRSKEYKINVVSPCFPIDAVSLCFLIDVVSLLSDTLPLKVDDYRVDGVSLCFPIGAVSLCFLIDVVSLYFPIDAVSLCFAFR